VSKSGCVRRTGAGSAQRRGGHADDPCREFSEFIRKMIPGEVRCNGPELMGSVRVGELLLQVVCELGDSPVLRCVAPQCNFFKWTEVGESACGFQGGCLMRDKTKPFSTTGVYHCLRVLEQPCSFLADDVSQRCDVTPPVDVLVGEFLFRVFGTTALDVQSGENQIELMTAVE